MPFTPTNFVNGQAPSISATQLNKLGTQYTQAVSDAPGIIASQIRNPESDLQAAVLDVTGGQLPSIGVYPIVTDDPNFPRPTDIPVGWVEFWFLITDDPNARPINAGNLAVVNIVEATAPPFDFAQLQGYSGDYDATSLVGVIADGGIVTSWPDISGNSRNLTPATVGSGSVTSSPLFDADGFGTSPNVPAVHFPSRSAIQYTSAAIGSVPSVITAANVKFRDVGTDSVETLNTFGTTPFGRYSISRVGVVGTSQRLQIANADATAYYQSAIGDYRGELALVGQWTPNVQRLWCNGTMIIEHTESTPVAMPDMASFRIGFASNAGDTGLARYAVDGRVNKFVWAKPTDVNYLTTDIVNKITTRLQELS